jgi:hypothetical protein
MSALPPKADIDECSANVRFVPEADSCTATSSLLFDHLVGASEECADFFGQRLGLLHRGEMATARHHGPPPDVGIHARRQRSRRTDDLARERRVAGRHVDRSPIRYRPRPVLAGVIGPERAADRTGEPVEADIRQQLVARERGLDIAVAIGPRAELLDDPRGKPDWRVRQPKGERLRARALDPLIAGFLPEPRAQLFAVGGFLRRRLAEVLRVAPDARQQVQVNAEEPVTMREAKPRGDRGAPVAALCGEPVVTEQSHEFHHAVGDLLNAKSLLSRREGQTIARQRRRDDGKSVCGVAAKARGSARRGMMSRNSNTEPGQPCNSRSGHGLGPTRSTRRK